MVAKRRIRQVLAVLLVVTVLASTFVAPVHAADDEDDGITIDGDGVDVGGDDGTGITLGDDENGMDTDVSVSADEGGASLSTDAELSVNEGGDAGDSLSLSCDFGTDDTDVSDDCDPNVVPENGGDGSLSAVDDAPDAPAGDLPSDGDVPDPSGSLPGAPTLPGAPSLPPLSPGDGGDAPPLPPFPGTPETPADVPALPVRYDDVPLESAPGDVCTQSVRFDDIPEPIDPYNPPGEENLPLEVPSTPVDPYSPPVSAPFTQCDVFDPYNPPFDPTDPPDDPSAEENRFARDVSQERVLYVGEQTFTTGEGGPEIENFGYVLVVPSENTTLFGAEPSLSDGQKQVAAGEFALAKRESTTEGSIDGAVLVFGAGGGAGLVCDGEECTPITEGVPQQDIPSIPTSGGGSIPCEAPGAPGGAPAPPVSPPEQVPESPEVDPSDAPNPNYCVLFNPNHPPVDPGNPPSESYQKRRTYHDTFGPNGGYTVGEDEAGFRSGPTANRFYGYGYDDRQVVYVEEVTIDTGERQYIVETSNVRTRDTSTVEGRSGVMSTMQNGSQSFPQGAELVCDGEKCEVVVTGDMGATDGFPPVYVDDDGDEDGTQSGSAEDSAASSGDSASERTVDAASDSVEEASEDVPDLSNPGDGVTDLLGL